MCMGCHKVKSFIIFEHAHESIARVMYQMTWEQANVSGVFKKGEKYDAAVKS